MQRLLFCAEKKGKPELSTGCPARACVARVVLRASCPAPVFSSLRCPFQPPLRHCQYTFPYTSTRLHMIQSTYDSYQLSSILQLDCVPSEKNCSAADVAAFHVRERWPKRSGARGITEGHAHSFACVLTSTARPALCPRPCPVHRHTTTTCSPSWTRQASLAPRAWASGATPAWHTPRWAGAGAAWPRAWGVC